VPAAIKFDALVGRAFSKMVDQFIMHLSFIADGYFYLASSRHLSPMSL
jgi:hypothetical protein